MPTTRGRVSGLGRENVPRLLQTVKNAPHASSDDHHDPLPTPPTSISVGSSSFVQEENIFRDPESSDDDSNAPALQRKSTGFIPPRQIDGSDDARPAPPSFKQATSYSPPKSAGKRSAELNPRDEDDEPLYSSQGSNKRQQTSNSPIFEANIHAPKRKQIGYGAKARQKAEKAQQMATTSGFKKAHTIQGLSNAAPKAKFKVAQGADIFEFGNNTPAAQFHTVRGAGNSALSSSTLSSAPASPGAEDQTADSPIEEANSPNITCNICGKLVDRILKQDFEDAFHKGRPILSYKWQQRFCRHHKVYEAKELREQRGYPDIDWSGLGERMQRHQVHLKAVTSGTRPSHHRELLKENVKNGRAKTTMQLVSTDGSKRGTYVGYYGPRGEKIMTEHIIAHLSDTIREHAVKDKVLAAAGVVGGVSGFVQAVLVPELAEQLIREDMKVDAATAREIIEESADVGELLYPDVDDEIGKGKGERS